MMGNQQSQGSLFNYHAKFAHRVGPNIPYANEAAAAQRRPELPGCTGTLIWKWRGSSCAGKVGNLSAGQFGRETWQAGVWEASDIIAKAIGAAK